MAPDRVLDHCLEIVPGLALRVDAVPQRMGLKPSLRRLFDLEDYGVEGRAVAKEENRAHLDLLQAHGYPERVIDRPQCGSIHEPILADDTPLVNRPNLVEHGL